MFIEILGGTALRYFVLSTIIYFVAIVVVSRILPHTRINSTQIPSKQQTLEAILWSFSTILIYSLGGLAVVAYFEPHGYVYFYEDIHKLGKVFGYVYLPLSLMAILFLHDFLYYLNHRLMHQRFFFKHIHSTHHRLKNPHTYATYMVHPIEAFLVVGTIIVPMLLVPLHSIVILLYVLILAFWNILTHCGVELFPRGLISGKIFGLLVTPTHHNMHHRLTNYNYANYFRVWDRFFKTEHDQYCEEFILHSPNGQRAAKNSKG